MREIPYGRQQVTEDDIAEVVKVLRSDRLTQGSVVPKFEAAIANYCGVNHGVAANSATAALHIACLALGVRQGDRVWTSAITFVASANCAVFCGASVDFIDIDPKTYNLSIDCLREKLIVAQAEGKLPKVLVAVHYAGQSCDMKAIRSLADQYGFYVIEDASHAIGAWYRTRYDSSAKTTRPGLEGFEPVGNCRFSHIAVFSFHPVKIITTGEGGMAMTNIEELANKMRCLRSHGVVVSPETAGELAEGEIWNYRQLELGFNYRLSDIHASLGLSQMGRLDDYVAKRHEMASRYDAQLADLPLTVPWQHPDCYSSYHLYPIRIGRGQTTKSRREIYDALRSAGIQVNLHYIPVYRHPYYKKFGFEEGYAPESERFFRDMITLPLFPTLSKEDQDQVIAKLKGALAK